MAKLHIRRTLVSHRGHQAWMWGVYAKKTDNMVIIVRPTLDRAIDACRMLTFRT